MSLRPPPRRAPSSPAPDTSGLEPLSAVQAALAASETILADAMARLEELEKGARQTKEEIESLLASLRDTVDALRNPGAANAPTITPLPFKLPPAVAGKRAPAPPRPGAEDEAEITPEPMTPPFPQPAIVPPPIPPEAMAPTTEMPDPSLAEPPSRSTSPLEETSEMKPVKPPPPPRPESEPGPEETTIRYNCAKCGRKLSAPAKFIGRAATCKCGERMPVPARSTRERGKP